MSKKPFHVNGIRIPSRIYYYLGKLSDEELGRIIHHAIRVSVSANSSESEHIRDAIVFTREEEIDALERLEEFQADEWSF